MFPFSMALMSGLKRQSVGARIASIPGSSSFSDIAKCVKLYICGIEQQDFTHTGTRIMCGPVIFNFKGSVLERHSFTRHNIYY